MTYEFKINCEINNVKYKKGDIVPEGVQYFPSTMKVVNETEEVKDEAPKAPNKKPNKKVEDDGDKENENPQTPVDPNTDEAPKTETKKK